VYFSSLPLAAASAAEAAQADDNAQVSGSHSVSNCDIPGSTATTTPWIKSETNRAFINICLFLFVCLLLFLL